MADSRVRNAADRDQVRKAKQQIKRERDQELSDLRTVLATAEGRRVLYHWIMKLRPLSNLWEPSAMLQVKAARHDVAVEMINAIDEADPHAWPRMQQDARTLEMQAMHGRSNDAKDEKETEG